METPETESGNVFHKSWKMWGEDTPNVVCKVSLLAHVFNVPAIRVISERGLIISNGESANVLTSSLADFQERNQAMFSTVSS